MSFGFFLWLRLVVSLLALVRSLLVRLLGFLVASLPSALSLLWGIVVRVVLLFLCLWFLSSLPFGGFVCLLAGVMSSFFGDLGGLRVAFFCLIKI